MSKEPTIAEELLKHATFVRRLAFYMTGDRHKAEDVEQEVWLAAARTPPRKAKAARSWLRVVVRNTVAKQGRDEARHPLAVEPSTLDELSPGAFENSADPNLLRSVVAQVLDLPEPYQACLLLRFYEGRTVQETADRLGCTHAQARSRINRALQLLESYLGEAHADESPNWRSRLGLACGLGAQLTSPPKNVVTMGAIMTKAKTAGVAALAIILCAVGFSVWNIWRDAEDLNLDAKEAAIDSAAGAAVRRERAEEQSSTTASTAVEESPEAKEAKTPSRAPLRLVVVWQDDQTPALAVSLMLISNSRSGSSKITRTTDRAGVIAFSTPPSSAFAIRSPRFPHRTLGRVQPKDRGDIKIEIPIGIDVVGKVVDRGGSAIAGASIVVAGANTFASSTTVGYSDPDGHFAIRHLSAKCYVAAWHADYAPSDLFSLPTSPEGEAKTPLVLTLNSEGSRILGRVLGLDGKPIVGALVKAGQNKWEMRTDPTGVSRYTPPAIVLRTGEDGSFDTGKLRSGAIDLLISAYDKDLAIHRETVQVAPGETKQHLVQLERPGVVFGVVRDENDSTLSRVFIYSNFHDPDIHGESGRGTTTDANGRFEIQGFPAGTVKLTAVQGARISKEITLINGERHEWNPVLVRGAVVRGRLLDDAGQPLVRWSVNAINANPVVPTWRRTCTTDAEGRFEFSQCPADQDLRLSFEHQDLSSSVPAAERIVRPHDEEVTFRLTHDEMPRSFVKGIALDHQGNRPPSVQIWLGRAGSGTLTGFSKIAKDGSFTIGPLSKGIYEVVVEAIGLGRLKLNPVNLRENDTHDLGKIRFDPPAKLTLEFSYLNRVPEGKIWVDIIRTTDQSNACQIVLTGQARASIPLAPGNYRISINGIEDSDSNPPQNVQLLPGSTTRFPLIINLP